MKGSRQWPVPGKAGTAPSRSGTRLERLAFRFVKPPRLATLPVCLSIALLSLPLAAPPASACDIPVYRWALENWDTDPYGLLVFQRGPLSSDDQTLLAQRGEPARANLTVQAVDVDAPMDAQTAAVWEAQVSPKLPWIVLRYPYAPPQWPDAWTGPLSEANVKALVDSPKRREIARLIAENSTAVWVFLGIGDPKKDAPALELIRRELTQMPAALQRMPLIAMEDRSAVPDASKGVSFTLVDVDRKDPAEEVLVAMLLGTESDLRSYDEPMVFPVFGRGRVLYAILGAGITHANILEACAFMFGACTCIVKEQNPGMDLLMTADWRAVLKGLPDLDAWAVEPGGAVDAVLTPFKDELPEDRASSILLLALISLAAAFLGIAATTLVLVWRSRRAKSS